MSLELEEENRLIQEKANEANDPFATASMLFGLYHPHFERMTQQLSTGELRRLVNALVTYPISDKMFLVEDSREVLRNAYHIGQSLLEAKTMMIIQTLQEKASQIDMTQVTRAEVPGTGMTADEIRRDE